MNIEALNDWKAGASLHAIARKHRTYVAAEWGRLIRKHLGEDEYEDACRMRRRIGSAAAWAKRQGRETVKAEPVSGLHPIFTRRWCHAESV